MARAPKFAEVNERLKMPAEEQAFDLSVFEDDPAEVEPGPAEVAAKETDPGYRPMDEVPDERKKIPKPLWLTPDGKRWESCQWRQTRCYSVVDRKWNITGEWVLANTRGLRPLFKPIGWKESDD